MVKKAENSEIKTPVVRLEFVPQVEYSHGDPHEQVTVPDSSPSLVQMVMSGNAGALSVGSTKYSYPDLDDDDDENHDLPDYEKLNKLDVIEKEEFVDLFLKNPKNYVKKEEESSGPVDAEEKTGSSVEEDKKASE